MATLALELDERLRRVREQTHALLAPLSDEQLMRQFTPIMSPPVWDMGHIAAYEELWLLGRVAGRSSLHPERAELYDATETPRSQRGEADLLDPAACREYMSEVRDASREVLGACDLGPGADRLVARGFVFEMVAEHEAQHTETVLQGLKMLPAGEYRPPRREAPSGPVVDSGPERVRFEGGRVAIGAPEAGFAYDCELPRHEVALAPFELARLPVTNGEHLAFIADGGYERRELWTDDGWAWREEHEAQAPLYWTRDGEGGWLERDYERLDTVDPGRILCHVSAHEADAHARWAGARLPTEAEWEHAARDASVAGANLGQRAFSTAPAGSGQDGGGCLHLLGDVWEWTATPFEAYPGFEAFPYPEYAEVFFGGPYRVLRGGSWATQQHAIRPSFRNWDLPERRQIFSGLRLAWDAS